MSPRSLLITGATGYLGRWVLKGLKDSNYEAIYCLSRAAGPAKDLQSISWLRGDLLDPAGYRRALAECDTVLHLAAMTGKGSDREHYRVNVEGTRILVQECRQAGVRNFLHVSTIAATFPNLRHYHYGQAKKLAEEIVVASGLHYVILRPTMIFSRNAPVLEGLSKMAGAPVVPIFGDGKTKVQPVFAGDVAQALSSILDSRPFQNTIIELGGADVLTIEDLLLRIRKIRHGKPGHTIHLPVNLISWVLATVEPLLLSVLPLTAGQMASFRNDSTAVNSASRWKQPTKGIDEILRLAVMDGN